MRELPTTKLGPLARALLDRARQEFRPGSLAFGTPVAEARDDLAGMNEDSLSPGRRVRMPQDFACLKAAFWLLYDFMPESHRLSQGIATPSGSYWHAILHRREPDASNSKYWFSRVGDHPVFTELIKDAKELAGPQPPDELQELVRYDAWNPDTFVKLCTGNPSAAASSILLAIQRREIELLFEYNYKKAFA